MSSEELKSKSELRIFLSYFKPHRRLFALDMSCALLVSAIDLAFPVVSRWCLNTLLPERAWQTFWTVMGLVFLTFVLRSFLQFTIVNWGHTFGARVETDMRRDLFRHIQKLGFDFFDQNRVGQLMSRLTTDLFDMSELSHHGPEDLFISALTIIGAIIIMFRIQWRLALVIAVMMPVFFAVIWKCRLSLRDTSRSVKRTTASINADFESALSGIRTAKAFANEEREYEKFYTASGNYRNAKYRQYCAMARFMSVMEFFLCSISAVVIAVGGALIMNGNLNLVDLVTFSLYITIFVNPVRKISMDCELIANGTAGLHRFVELMRLKPALDDAPDARELTEVKGDIELKQVSFSYRDNPEVLHQVSLHIHPGETVALVGSSGGGKTTISQLIPRFYDVTGGAVCVDGEDVRKLTQESLRRNIGVVQQEVFLFADSIAENIRYGSLDATEEQIAEAAKMAEIYEDIQEMPDGFQTNVGERGVLLSGGQKQRISIARIFLKNPPVLILDEATSALDSVTEAKIQKTFEKLSQGRTTIIIAHRLSTVRHADRIAVIEDGSIVELGSHSELMAKQGVYASLVKTQELAGS